MPYYIFRITEIGPVKNLEKLAEYAVFKEASAEAKRLRKEADDPSRIKMNFGENQLQAEEALLQYREPQPVLGDD